MKDGEVKHKGGLLFVIANCLMPESDEYDALDRCNVLYEAYRIAREETMKVR